MYPHHLRNAVAWLIVNIIKDLENALSFVESALEKEYVLFLTFLRFDKILMIIMSSPTLAPLVTVLSDALNGPVVMLLRTVTGLTSGLLALVQRL